MKKNFSKLIYIALAFASLLYFSCSMDGIDSSSGSITMTLPSSSQMGKSSGVSRSVVSGGSIEVTNIASFKVYVRNFSTKEEIVQTVTPGSSITIDELEPGTWSVAIRGLNVDNEVIYYGSTDDITVNAGETAPAKVSIRSITTPYLNYQLSEAPSEIRYAYIKYSCSQLNQEGEAFYECTNLSSDEHEIRAPAPEFFEPGYTYSISGLFYNSSGQLLWNANYSQTVPKNGGAIYSSETFDEQENKLYTSDILNGNYYIGEDLTYFISQYITGFTIEGLETPVSIDDVSIRALATDYCGTVPIIFTYKDYSYIIAMIFYHPVNPPSLYMDDISIPVGVTRDVSSYLTMSPSSPELWQIYGPDTDDNTTVYDSYGFSKYGLHGKTDSDTWSTASLTKVSDSTYTTVSETSITGATASDASEIYEWSVTATGSSSYGANQNNGVSQAFNVNCVAWTVDAPETVARYIDYDVYLYNTAATQAELEALELGLITFSLNGASYETSDVTKESGKIKGVVKVTDSGATNVTFQASYNADLLGEASHETTVVDWALDNTALTPTLYSPFSVTLTNSAATSLQLSTVASSLSYKLEDETVVNGGAATVSGNSIVINFAGQDGWGLSDPKTINIIYDDKKLATFTVEYIQELP